MATEQDRDGPCRAEYVRGPVHTNTIEGFWSQLKRSIDGTHHHVSSWWLRRYVAEHAWRYSRRHSADPLFLSLLDRVTASLPARAA